jgi:hypothetical protein
VPGGGGNSGQKTVTDFCIFIQFSNGEAPRQKCLGPLDKNGERTLQDEHPKKHSKETAESECEKTKRHFIKLLMTGMDTAFLGGSVTF